MRAFLLALWRLIHYKLTHVTEEKWRILAACLLVSGMLWFLRQMNKTYTTGMKVRLSFEYDRGRFVPLDPLPNALWLNVTAEGWPLAIAAYSPTRPRLVVQPVLDKGYWMADADKVKRYLQPKLARVQINYLQELPQAYRFDSIVQRQVPIEATLPDGRRAFGRLCYKGLSGQLLRLPRAHVLTEAPWDSTQFSVSTSSLYDEKWLPSLCQPRVAFSVR